MASKLPTGPSPPPFAKDSTPEATAVPQWKAKKKRQKERERKARRKAEKRAREVELLEAPEDMGTAQNISVPASNEDNAGAPETEPVENVSVPASHEDHAGPAPVAGFETVPRVEENTARFYRVRSFSQPVVGGRNQLQSRSAHHKDSSVPHG
jgi:hypothetical protein